MMGWARTYSSGEYTELQNNTFCVGPPGLAEDPLCELRIDAQKHAVTAGARLLLLPRSKSLVPRSGFFGFALFSFYLFSRSTLIFLKMLKRTEVHLKSSFGIENRLFCSFQFCD